MTKSEKQYKSNQKEIKVHYSTTKGRKMRMLLDNPTFRISYNLKK